MRRYWRVPVLPARYDVNDVDIRAQRYVIDEITCSHPHHLDSSTYYVAAANENDLLRGMQGSVAERGEGPRNTLMMSAKHFHPKLITSSVFTADSGRYGEHAVEK
ncbi:unnamed protein product [Taenia asiatica]|uniref:BAH domain-containing protein n=1 Tax=Taenia asiatica TaxID=60517 RepID=A0A0R3WCZ7_TAEAS|nr:unnamed protein product [Taenia asiatica]